MEDRHAPVPYRVYGFAWLFLLGLTLLMVYSGHPMVLILGMMAKATIIGLFFMHLLYERLSFVLIIVLSILATGMALFALIAPDGYAM